MWGVENFFQPKMKRLKDGTLFLGYDRIGSTNIAARDYLDCLGPEEVGDLETGIVFVAKQQFTGKGQHERVWESNLGGLYYTLLIQRFEFRGDLAVTALNIGHTVAAGILSVTQIPIEVKAPNDLMYQGAKVGGVLMEATTKFGVPVIIVGVGLNVNQHHFSDEIAWRASSLSLIAGKRLDIMPIVAEITKGLKAFFS